MQQTDTAKSLPNKLQTSGDSSEWGCNFIYRGRNMRMKPYSETWETVISWFMTSNHANYLTAWQSQWCTIRKWNAFFWVEYVFLPELHKPITKANKRKNNNNNNYILCNVITKYVPLLKVFKRGIRVWVWVSVCQGSSGILVLWYHVYN